MARTWNRGNVVSARDWSRRIGWVSSEIETGSRADGTTDRKLSDGDADRSEDGRIRSVVSGFLHWDAEDERGNIISQIVDHSDGRLMCASLGADLESSPEWTISISRRCREAASTAARSKQHHTSSAWIEHSFDDRRTASVANMIAWCCFHCSTKLSLAWWKYRVDVETGTLTSSAPPTCSSSNASGKLVLTMTDFCVSSAWESSCEGSDLHLLFVRSFVTYAARLQLFVERSFSETNDALPTDEDQVVPFHGVHQTRCLTNQRSLSFPRNNFHWHCRRFLRRHRRWSCHPVLLVWDYRQRAVRRRCHSPPRHSPWRSCRSTQKDARRADDSAEERWRSLRRCSRTPIVRRSQAEERTAKEKTWFHRTRHEQITGERSSCANLRSAVPIRRSSPIGSPFRDTASALLTCTIDAGTAATRRWLSSRDETWKSFGIRTKGTAVRWVFSTRGKSPTLTVGDSGW